MVAFIIILYFVTFYLFCVRGGMCEGDCLEVIEMSCESKTQHGERQRERKSMGAFILTVAVSGGFLICETLNVKILNLISLLLFHF